MSAKLVIGPADYANAGAMLRGVKARVERSRHGERVVSPEEIPGGSN